MRPLSVQDNFDFLAAYLANDSCADFNASATLFAQDLFGFLEAYILGCQ